jgi:hypothetical protein
MSVTVVKQFVATIGANQSVVWNMAGASPGFNPRLRDDANPRWIISWQAVPVVTTVDLDSPGIENENLAIGIVEHLIFKTQADLTHRITIVCKDIGRRPTRSKSILTYALFATFVDL